VIDSSEAKPLYSAIVDFMELELGMPIPEGMRDVPVLAVDLPSLNEQRSNTAKVYHSAGGSGTSITRGLTLKEHSSISHFEPGSLVWNGALQTWTSTGPRMFRTESVRSATAVLVLFGLPKGCFFTDLFFPSYLRILVFFDFCFFFLFRFITSYNCSYNFSYNLSYNFRCSRSTDATASILAHEAMHVWCSLTKDFPFVLPPHVEEGICQLISFKYVNYIRSTDILDTSTPTNRPKR
jgi:Protein DA1